MAEDSGESFDSMIEYYKVFIDVVKSTTTLAAGILVLLATFHDKLSKGTHSPWLIVVAVITFLYCIVHNVTLCYNSIFIIGEYGHDKTVVRIEADKQKVLDRLRETNQKVGKLERRMRVSLRVSHWCFVVGIVAIGVFVLLNF